MLNIILRLQTVRQEMHRVKSPMQATRWEERLMFGAVHLICTVERYPKMHLNMILVEVV